MPTEKKLTGYPSIDKPWLKYYTEEAINAKLPECTIYEYLWENNKDNLDEIALIYFGKEITYRELFENIEKTAKAFVSIGVKNEIVSVCLPSVPEAIYTIYALNKIGAVPDLLDPRTNSEGLEFFLKESKSKFLVTIDTVNEKFVAIKNKTLIQQTISVSPANSLSVFKKVLYKLKTNTNTYDSIPWNKFVKKTSKVEFEANNTEKDLAVIVHTGGTTGVPKGVMLSNKSINSIAHQYKAMFDYTRGQTLLDVIPPFASYGLCTSIHMPLSLGVSVILIPKFTLETFPDLLIEHKPNYIVGVPSFLNTLLDNQKIKDFDLSFLVCAACGGDTISKSNENKLNDFFASHNSNTLVTKGYGMSEMSATAVSCFGEVNRITSVGIPMVCNNVCIVNPDTNEELTYEQLGEICITGPGMMIGYFNNLQLTNSIIKEHADGKRWIHTGDLGHISNDGFLYHNGRIKRMIVRYDGFKIYPEAIEKILSNHSDVSNCAIIKHEKAGLGTLPLAYIVKSENAKNSEENIKIELFKVCKNNLPERAVPENFIFIDKMPLTPIGKVDYRALEKEAEKL